MARQRLEQPYQSYDPDSGTLHQSTHAPGQGGSSGMAINMLSRGAGATNMAQDPRYAWSGAFTGGVVPMDANENRAYWERTGRAQNENALEQQNYARASGPGTRYEQEVERRRNQILDDAREREQYDLALRRRADGLPPTEEGRQFDARMAMQGNLANALAQAMGRQQFFGGNETPPWMQPQRGQAQSQYGQGLGMGDETRNYLMKFLRG